VRQVRGVVFPGIGAAGVLMKSFALSLISFLVAFTNMALFDHYMWDFGAGGSMDDWKGRQTQSVVVVADLRGLAPSPFPFFGLKSVGSFASIR